MKKKNIKSTVVIAAAAAVLCLAGCGSKTTQLNAVEVESYVTGEFEQETEAVKEIVDRDYVVIAGNNSEAGSILTTALKAASDEEEMDENTIGKSNFAVVLGNANIEGVGEYVDELADGECCIIGTENRIYICGCNTEDEIYAAQYFAENYLGYDAATGTASVAFDDLDSASINEYFSH